MSLLKTHFASYAGLEKPQCHFRGNCEQENHRLGFFVSRLLLQYHPALHHLHPCQLGFGKFTALTVRSLVLLSLMTVFIQLTSFVPFLEDWSQASPVSFTFISGVLPPAVSALFGFFLPIIMRWLSKYQGALTHSRLDRAVVARYFAFLVISQLVIFTLIGVLFSTFPFAHVRSQLNSPIPIASNRLREDNCRSDRQAQELP